MLRQSKRPVGHRRQPVRQLTIGNWTAADIAGANKEDAFRREPTLANAQPKSV